jgi:hypothetical protein
MKKILIVLLFITALFSNNDFLEPDLTHLETMMPYFEKVEVLAARKVMSLFGGETQYGIKYGTQKLFLKEFNNFNLMCYVDIYNKFGKYEPLKTISENDYDKKWIHKNDSNLDIMSIIEENSVMNPNMDCWTEETVYFERKYRYDKVLDMNIIMK